MLHKAALKRNMIMLEALLSAEHEAPMGLHIDEYISKVLQIEGCFGGRELSVSCKITSIHGEDKHLHI